MEYATDNYIKESFVSNHKLSVHPRDPTTVKLANGTDSHVKNACNVSLTY